MFLITLYSLLLFKPLFAQVPAAYQIIESMSKKTYSKAVQIQQEVIFSQYPDLVVNEVWDFIHPLKVFLQVSLPTQPPIILQWHYIDSSKVGPLFSQRASKSSSGFITEALWYTNPSTSLLNLLESSGWSNLQVGLSRQQGQVAYHLYREDSKDLYQGLWVSQQNSEPLRLKTTSQCDVQYENQNLKKQYQFENISAVVYLNSSTPIGFLQQSQLVKKLPQQINLTTNNSQLEPFIKQVLLFYERCR